MEMTNTTNHPEIIHAMDAWYETLDGKELVKEDAAKRDEARRNRILEDTMLALEVNSNILDISLSIVEATKKGECLIEVYPWDWNRDTLWYIVDYLNKRGYEVKDKGAFGHEISWLR